MCVRVCVHVCACACVCISFDTAVSSCLVLSVIATTVRRGSPHMCGWSSNKLLINSFFPKRLSLVALLSLTLFLT